MAYRNRGWLYCKLKNYNAALVDFNQAVALSPNDNLAYHFRGLAYEKLGDKQRAQADAAKARELGYNG